MLDFFFIRVLGDEFVEVNVDVFFFCFFSEFFNFWSVIVVISCNCFYLVLAEIFNNVCYGSGLVFIIGDGTEEGFELIFVVEEFVGGGIVDLERI